MYLLPKNYKVGWNIFCALATLLILPVMCPLCGCGDREWNNDGDDYILMTTPEMMMMLFTNNFISTDLDQPRFLFTSPIYFIYCECE